MQESYEVTDRTDRRRIAEFLSSEVTEDCEGLTITRPLWGTARQSAPASVATPTPERDGTGDCVPLGVGMVAYLKGRFCQCPCVMKSQSFARIKRRYLIL